MSFDANSAQMRAADLAALREIATEQRKRGGTLRVVGYSQSPVSSERAEQVARTLVGNGVKPDRVYAGAMPQSDPGYLDLRPEAVSANRRVDIYIDY
ncbi:MAG: OmpA family protein [Alphaproteobacteria bacterium]